MKSEITERRHIVECACHAIDHLLVFDYDEEEGWIDVYMTYNWRTPWYNRIWNAIIYIFLKEERMFVSDMTITDENIEQLGEIVKLLKKFYRKKVKLIK